MKYLIFPFILSIDHPSIYWALFQLATAFAIVVAVFIHQTKKAKQ